MDQTETFTKMCEKAEEIQEQRREVGARDDVNICSACKTRWGNCYEHEEFLTCKSELGGRSFPVARVKHVEHKSVWLPRQDQLQEMYGNVGDLPFTILECFYEYVKALTWDENPSYEQLWLAFVMKEKYSKVWNGEDWVPQ